MLTDQIVKMLVEERDRISRAIEALTGGQVKRRGRPPKNPMMAVVAPTTSPVAPKRKGRTWTAAQKKAAAERMRARHAARKKAAK